MTATINAVKLSFELNTAKFNVLVSTEGTGDCMEDIWNDIWSYIYNVSDAAEDFEDGIQEVFKDYPDYTYEIKEV